MGVPENQSSQNSNKRQRSEESDGSSDSDTRQPTAQVTSQSALNVPRFLVVQSADSSRKVSDLSPFVIEKCIVSLAGQPKSIKKLKSGDLLLEVEKKKHIENLLRTKKLFDLDVNISLHKTLNCSKGVIRCEDLGPCTDVEILDHLRSQGVQDIRNIQVRRNGVLKRTSTYVLTFNTPIMPKKIKAAYISVNVEVYVPNPLRCYHCQVFGHHESRCNRQKLCANCGEDKHCSDDRNCDKTAKCVNCSGPHPTFSRDCPTWHKEKEILKIKYTRNLSFFEARKIVEQQSSTASRNYASIIRSAGTQVKLVDAMTQTDETYDVQIKTHQNPGGDAPSGTNQTAGGKASPAQAGGKPPPAQNPPSNKTAGKPPTGGKPPTAGGKPPAPPKPLSPKDRRKLLSERVPKGADDPVRTDNYYDCLEETSMEADVTPPSPRKVHLPRIPNT